MDENKPTRAELLKRLHTKQQSFRNNTRIPVSEKEHNKMVNQMKKEMTQLQNDPRITSKMTELYKQACKLYTTNNKKKMVIASPFELLKNETMAKQKFAEYLSTLLMTCKEKQIEQTEFVNTYLNSIYNKYHIEVLGIDIIPVKLQPFINGKTDGLTNCNKTTDGIPSCNCKATDGTTTCNNNELTKQLDLVNKLKEEIQHITEETNEINKQKEEILLNKEKEKEETAKLIKEKEELNNETQQLLNETQESMKQTMQLLEQTGEITDNTNELIKTREETIKLIEEIIDKRGDNEI